MQRSSARHSPGTASGRRRAISRATSSTAVSCRRSSSRSRVAVCSPPERSRTDSAPRTAGLSTSSSTPDRHCARRTRGSASRARHGLSRRRRVLLVDDVADSGRTLALAVQLLKDRAPTCARSRSTPSLPRSSSPTSRGRTPICGSTSRGLSAGRSAKRTRASRRQREAGGSAAQQGTQRLDRVGLGRRLVLPVALHPGESQGDAPGISR